MNNVDFYISSNGRLIIPEYNINYLVNLRESTLSLMPESNESTAKVAGRDGDVVLSTTYEPISFNIICYTEDNLSPEEKVEEERKINAFLHSIKKATKKMGIEKYGTYYDVKYTGKLTTINYPKHMNFSIPLKSSSSYGRDINKKKITGNGTLSSNTVEPVGAVFTINGPATKPKIAFNDYQMEYNYTVLDGNKLIIDTNKSTITLVNNLGVRTNAMRYYNHQFPRVIRGSNTLKVNSGVNSASQVSVEWNDLLL